MKAFVLLLVLLFQGDRIRELIERLRSDDADQRNRATIALKKLARSLEIVALLLDRVERVP